MIEQGLVMLIQAGLGSPPLASGGFFSQLPKDQIDSANPMAWAYRFITTEPTYVMDSQRDWTESTIQIDCHGYTAADSIRLSGAIEKALRGGFRGTLADPDATVVQGIFQQSKGIDGFSDANRSYVRSLDYLVQYNQK